MKYEARPRHAAIAADTSAHSRGPPQNAAPPAPGVRHGNLKPSRPLGNSRKTTASRQGERESLIRLNHQPLSTEVAALDSRHSTAQGSALQQEYSKKPVPRPKALRESSPGQHEKDHAIVPSSPKALRESSPGQHEKDHATVPIRVRAKLDHSHLSTDESFAYEAGRLHPKPYASRLPGNIRKTTPSCKAE